MSPRYDEAKRAANSFPRVSGDEPEAESVAYVVAAFSPRERG